MQTAAGNLPAAIADFQHSSTFTSRAEFQTSGPRITQASALTRVAWLEARRANTARSTESYASALMAARQVVRDFPDVSNAFASLAVVHARRGERTEALVAIEKALQLAIRMHDAQQLVFGRLAKAEVLAALGDIAPAIVELRVVHEMGWGFGYTLRLDLEWEPLRQDAKFQQLMKEAEARADAQPRPKK